MNLINLIVFLRLSTRQATHWVPTDEGRWLHQVLDDRYVVHDAANDQEKAMKVLR
jgi:hypothetical protein